MPEVCVIIAAAGRSVRFSGEENKTFASLDGSPMFLRTLEAFVNRPDVVQTILAVAPGDVAQMREKFGPNLGFMGVQLAEGGEHRCLTIRNALNLVREDVKLVAVHDAARPCVSYLMIDAVFDEANKTGAAILAAPIRGTLKQVDEARIVSQSVSREGLYEAQTPQVFHRAVILDAYRSAKSLDASITDDAQLVEQMGHPVHVVESDATNLKVTTKADLKLANFLYKNKPRPKVDAPRSPFEEAQW